MSARPTLRSARRVLPRAAVVPVAALAALAVGVTPAGAAPGLTIPLDPPRVDVLLFPVENYPEDGAVDGDWFSAVEVEWGGDLVVQLPAVLDASDASVTLDTGSTIDAEPTRTLSTDAEGAAHLDVTDLGGGALRVELPADDPTSGPVGLLTVGDLTGPDAAIVVESLPYLLEFTGSGSSAVTVEPQLSAFSTMPCAFDVLDAAACPPYPATAGHPVTITVPDGSPLRSLGMGRLDDVLVALSPVLPLEEYDSAYDQGYSDGYEAGYSEAHGEGYGDSYGASYGLGYSDADEGYDAGYDDGLGDGRSDGSADSGTGGADDPATVTESLTEVLAGAAEPAEGTSPASAMARVAEAVAAVDEVTGTDPAAVGTAAASDPAAAAEVDAAAAGEDGTDTTGVYVAESVELQVSATAAGATVTLPADTAPGAYELVLVEGAGPLAPSSAVVLTLDVAAAPVVAAAAAAPPAAAPAPAVNVGLRSETGWEEHSGTSPLVAVGAAALAVAALGTVVVLRPRRRGALDAAAEPLR